MSNYSKATNFRTKDDLISTDPLKTIKGAEIDDEFIFIQTAIATKADTNSPTLTGVPIAPTAAPNTNSIQIATTAFTMAATTAALATLGTMSTQNKTAVDITGGNITGLSSALPVASGGTGVTTSTGSGANVLSTSPTLVTPALGTPSALVGTNITGTANGLNAGIGVNQTWQSFSAGQRPSTTWFQNTTGKPIAISMMTTGDRRTQFMYVNTSATTTGAITIAYSLQDTGTNNTFNTLYGIIPNNMWYYVFYNGSFNFWSELR